jgi:AcrR family transcriptional regulator
MKVTKDEIVRLADQLIRDVGYNSFSYTDISRPLQIKNSSIHYHFPSKSDLGVEVIRRAADKFIAETIGWRALTYKQQLSKIVGSYAQKQQSHCVCLVGALSPVFDTLSPEMQQELKRIVVVMLDQLEDIMKKGREKGEFDYTGSPKVKAYMIQSSLVASLLLDRVLQDEAFQVIQDEIMSI